MTPRFFCRAWNVPAFLCLLVGLACTPGVGPLSGGTSETTNGVSATVHNPNGTPAAGAAVRLRRSDYVTPVSMSERNKSAVVSSDALTDNNGRFEIRRIDPGSYLIEVTTGSTGVVLACSFSTDDSLQDFGSDTLRSFGVIRTTVDTAGQSGNRLYAQIAGLERLVAVDSTGSFTMNDIPAGTFSVRVISSVNTAPVIRRDSVSVVSDDTTSIPMTGWRFSKRVYINTAASGANVVENVYGFPLLVRLDQSNFDFSQAGDSGQDIRFTKSDNTPVSYEIEQWDRTNNRAVIWVLMDTVYRSNDRQYINMYWGAPSTIAPISGSNGATVFDTTNGFAGVWHFAPADTFADATDNRNNASGGGNSVVAGNGCIGQARRLDGRGPAIVVPDAPSLRMQGDFSAGLWLAADTTASWKIWRYLLSKGDGTANESNYHILFYEDTLTTSMVGGYHDGSAPAFQCKVSAFPWRDGAWHFVQLVKKNGDLILYLDGEARARISGPITVITSTADVKIGSDYQEQAVFAGTIDEVRISAVARGPAWIRLCYENQRADQNVVKVHQ